MHESQKQQILEHLKKHGGITPLDALERYGCLRLGARICDLRREGWTIRTEPTVIKRRTPDGRWVQEKTFATYVLVR